MSCYFYFVVLSLGPEFGECYGISLYFVRCCVGVSVCLVCCVFVNCLVKQFAMCLGVDAILLLNVMDVFSVGGGALLDRPCMVFQRMCLLCLLSLCCFFV